MIRAIFFDAVGTVLRADPSVVEVYARFARGYGLHLTQAELRDRFRIAFFQEREYDREHNWRTDELREQQRWRRIVQTVFPELADTAPMFSELWHYFARPDAWTCYREVADVLERLAARGYRLGIASNYDGRLRQIYQNLPCLRRCSWLVISSEIGWLKPARQFFDTVAQTVGLPGGEILYVGDDYETDCLSALEAGFQTAWLNRDLADQGASHGLPAGVMAMTTEQECGALRALQGFALAKHSKHAKDKAMPTPYVLANLEGLLTLLPPSAIASS